VSWRTGRALLVFVVFLAGWEVAARLGLLSRFTFSSPSQVGEYLWGSIREGTLGAATLVTLRRLLLGYAIGLTIGLPLGVLNARYQTVSDTLGLVALGLQTLPSVCWVMPALLWFGQTETTMLFIVVMGTVWAILLATDHGLRSIPPLYLRAARTMGARGLRLVTRVLVPASLPFVVSGMKQGWAFAWRSLMAAEIYITVLDATGLGQILHYGRELTAIDQVFGVMFVIVVVGLVVDRLLFSPFERFLHHRWGTAR
jgi:NitT/TauT family transport system permease protein